MSSEPPAPRKDPMSPTLFGHLALRFASSPENLATEALSFVLNRSGVANEAFVRYLRQVSTALPARLKFETQASGEDAAIPDLVGLDDDGQVAVIGEAKFWAGLT